MREMPAKSVASENEFATPRQVVRPSDKQLSPVTETTLYPAEFSILLRGLMEGKTVEEVAQILDVPEKHVGRFLSGNWRPTKEMLKKMGLKVVTRCRNSMGPLIAEELYGASAEQTDPEFW